MKTFGIVMLVISIVIAASIIGFMGTTCNNAQNQVQDHVVNNSFDSYEDFQEIYNSCKKLNEDLCNIESVPDTDKMFQQFSKSQRIVGLKNNLNRWIEEYNAKSKMWNRSMWKSKTLPYQIGSADFSCY